MLKIFLSLGLLACVSVHVEGITDCEALLKGDGTLKNGVYSIRYDSAGPEKKVYCDMSNGGWTVIFQRYMNKDINFHLEWKSYRNGFGDPANTYWLGNEFVHHLTKTKQIYKLRVVFIVGGEHKFAEYDYFKLEPESLSYTIRLGSFQPSKIEDGFTHPMMKNKIDNLQFSTPDNDKDHSSANCAASFGAGWWFRDCHAAALTLKDHLEWKNLCTSKNECTFVKMMIKRE